MIFGNNLSALAIAKGGQTNRSKHIDVRFHFIRDHLNRNTIGLGYINTNDLCADVLTKNLNKIKHLNCIKFIGLCMSCQNLRGSVKNV